jgi:RNA 2',3'-cyclic 3'-phosphodiesterase
MAIYRGLARTMKRLFIAVDISENARNLASKYIARLRDEFPDIRAGWERPEKLHITLTFLGRTDGELIDQIKMKMAEIVRRQNSFNIAMEGTGVFPSVRSPRVLWLGIADGSKMLAHLAEAVIQQTAKLGFEPENRRFKAHLTIARLKEPQSSKDLAERHLDMRYEPVQFEVSSLVLYESQLKPTGSVYTKLELFQFSR